MKRRVLESALDETACRGVFYFILLCIVLAPIFIYIYIYIYMYINIWNNISSHLLYICLYIYIASSSKINTPVLSFDQR